MTKLQIRLTMKNIKICLTERWYSWEEARVAAMEDEEVDLYADPRKGQSAYLPKELTEVSALKHGKVRARTDFPQEEAFETSEQASLNAPDAQIRENIAAETARQEVRA